jgi:hypothetical protein
MTKFFGQNHRGRDDWTRQCTATDFVDAGYASDAISAEFFLITKSAAPVHPRKSLTDLRA